MVWVSAFTNSVFDAISEKPITVRYTTTMLYVVFIICELIILSFISRWMIQRLFEAVYILTKARSVAVSFITLLLFPGTIIHELSHLFTAGILGVRTGAMELTPTSIKGDHIHAGSVMVAKTDPIRQSVIGLAPLITGLAILTAISYYLNPWWQESVLSIQNGQFISLPVIRFLVSLIILSAVSNTMFSSPEDLKGVPAVAITLVILAVGLYFLGIRLTLTGPVLTAYIQSGKMLTLSLGIVLALNGVLLLIANVLLTLTSKITKRHIVR